MATAADMINDRKKEWHLCGACCCANQYLFMPASCASADLIVCLCIGEDCSCLPVEETVPKVCTLLPFCTVFPKVGCCETVGSLYAGNEAALAGYNQKKLGMTVLQSHCFGPLCAVNQYCLMPYTCIANEGATCLCIGNDCAFPCVSSIPNAFGMYGIICLPSFACCPKLIDVFPTGFAQDQPAQVANNMQA